MWTPPRCSPAGGRWTRGGRWSGRRAATRTRRWPRPREREEVRADRDGYVTGVDAYAMGVAAWRLGAGRARKEDPVSAGGRGGPAPAAGRPGAGRRRALRAAGRRRGPDPGGARGGPGRGDGSGVQRRPPVPLVIDRIAPASTRSRSARADGSDGGGMARADRAADPDPGARAARSSTSTWAGSTRASRRSRSPT